MRRFVVCRQLRIAPSLPRATRPGDYFLLECWGVCGIETATVMGALLFYLIQPGILGPSWPVLAVTNQLLAASLCADKVDLPSTSL